MRTTLSISYRKNEVWTQTLDVYWIEQAMLLRRLQFQFKRIRRVNIIYLVGSESHRRLKKKMIMKKTRHMEMRWRNQEEGTGDVVQFAECLPIIYRVQRLIPALWQHGVAIHACNHNTSVGDRSKSRVQKFKVIHSYDSEAIFNWWLLKEGNHSPLGVWLRVDCTWLMG